MEKGPKPFQQVRAVDTVKIGGIYRDMRSIRGESVHSPRGDAGGEVLKGGMGRGGGGPLLRVPVVDDVAPVAVRALVPLQEAAVDGLAVSGQGDGNGLIAIAVQNSRQALPGSVFKVVLQYACI